jgi:DNA repair ATPase RecN
MNTLEAYDILCKRIENKIIRLESELLEQKERVNALRKNAKNREDQESLLKQAEYILEEERSKLSQLKEMKKHVDDLDEINKNISEMCEKRNEIYNTIGPSARLFDLEIKSIQRDA